MRASERYRAREDLELGLRSVRMNAALDQRYERRESPRAEHYFVLHAPNGDVIAISDMYASAPAMEKGIAAAKTHAATAPVEFDSDNSARRAQRR
jgi:uncharacterized protein YegP (UPF0339 family)